MRWLAVCWLLSLLQSLLLLLVFLLQLPCLLLVLLLHLLLLRVIRLLFIQLHVLLVLLLLEFVVAHGTVVEKVSVIPTPAFKAPTEIAVAVIDPAVEAYVRPPIAVIENKSVAPNPNRLESTGNRFPATSPT